jgi:hypothetical protein
MTDTQSIVAALQAALLHRYGDEVDLIFQYGSHLQGTTHRYSDVDLSWTPVHDATGGSITVMVDDTLYDLYPIHWAELARMAEFRNISASVLLHNRLLYRRTAEAATRFATLAARLRTLLEPAARPEMVRRSLQIFQQTGYDVYLLRVQAEAGHQAGALRQANSLLRTVLHSLAVCNQAVIDTRKLAQVLALPRLPEGFDTAVQCVVAATEPQAIRAATEALLDRTHNFLLAEQRQHLREVTPWPAAFHAAYPELKRDLQAVMLACEQTDLFATQSALLSLLHEMSRMISQVTGGVTPSSFNGLADYAQELTAFGFPALLPLMIAGDFAGLQQACLRFDQRLQEFLTERKVHLNNFATLEALERFLQTGEQSEKT